MKKIYKIMWFLAAVVALASVYLAASAMPGLLCRKGYTPGQDGALTVVAHRGGAALGPENSLAAIAAGLDAGADMIEIDIHQTKDGRLVVCHDESIDRTTDGRGRIEHLMLDEIRSHHIVDAGGRVTDQVIPTLEEVLGLVDGRAGLLVEIKRTKGIYVGIEEKLVAVLRERDAFSWVVAQSFNDSVLENLHAIEPSLRLEKLWVFKLFGLPLAFDGTLRKYSFDKYSYVSSFNFYHAALTRRMVDRIHSRGKQVKIWTVGAPADTPRLPVDGIISDDPRPWLGER